MRVAFFLPNNPYKDGLDKGLDYNKLEVCNPGMGGTEYEILAVAYWLSKSYIGRHKIHLYAQSIENLPEVIKSNAEKVRDFEHAIKIASKNNIDCFVA